MAHILLNYGCGLFLVCFMFRQVCQDPTLAAATEDEEDRADVIVQKLKDNNVEPVKK